MEEQESKKLGEVVDTVNPYAPMEGTLSTVEPLALQPVFWGLMVAFLVACFGLLLSPLIAVGVIGIPAVILGGIRAFAYASRARSLRLTKRIEAMRENPFGFFLWSIFFGFLTTLASFTAFVVSCFPVGLAYFEVNSNSGNPMFIVMIVCSVFGLVVGGLFVRASLPKTDAS